MRTILITGATGNVGLEVIKSLSQIKRDFQVIAGVREPKTDDDLFGQLHIDTVHFDFSDEQSINSALKVCDTLFLLRPPQLSDVEKYFNPLIRIAQEKSVKHIVFLSVQGADTSSLIPHHKIEKLIIKSGINYTFLRPAYFMQNFTTTLRRDLVQKNSIYLPAGNAKFTLVDVEDVGKVAAKVLALPAAHINKAYDLTNEERLNFNEMADVLSNVLGREISYKSPNLLSFYFTKRQEGIPSQFILVMIMLHFLPRFQKLPHISPWVQNIIDESPNSFAEFVKKNENLLQPNQ
ncbi:NmrA family NAD(P)-binding protein [Pontibacter sp. SD6]|uniref:NmrA family NAD(P)-binding protein n=1 Tax=Pontibacter cellulosilyticus TaxID=1720253 RepID=A0A923N681_9BACT|nr:NmrA family NAD(P)-binding protein [Pontibacter cellulosilyticus]